jgi:hypothetical protein
LEFRDGRFQVFDLPHKPLDRHLFRAERFHDDLIECATRH